MEAICYPLQILLQPILTGPLYYLLENKPEILQLSPITSTLAQRSGFKYAIAALLGLGVLRKVNNWLSALHLNAFTPNSHWDWKNEVVVLTGGSSGIGAQIVTSLAESGAQVVILDIAPPKGMIGSSFARRFEK